MCGQASSSVRYESLRLSLSFSLRLHSPCLNQSWLIPTAVLPGHWTGPKDGRNVNPFPFALPFTGFPLLSRTPSLVWMSAKFRKFPRAAMSSWIPTLIFHLHSPYKLILAHYEIQVHGCANLLIAHRRNSPAVLSSHDGACRPVGDATSYVNICIIIFWEFCRKTGPLLEAYYIGEEKMFQFRVSYLYSYRDTLPVYL